MSERMKEKKRIGQWTFTPEVPSIEMISKTFELMFADYKNQESFQPGDKLIIQWVNRHNYTLGVRCESETPQSSMQEEVGQSSPSEEKKQD